LTGSERLLFFFVGLVTTFVFIRISVRMIRAKVRWWPRNVVHGDTHVHHVVFGTVLLLLSSVSSLVIPDDMHGARLAAAAGLGVGAALVLDEFALILHLRDVYWTKAGRLSVDAVFLAVGLTGLFLLGARPLGYDEVLQLNPETTPASTFSLRLIAIGINLCSRARSGPGCSACWCRWCPRSARSGWPGRARRGRAGATGRARASSPARTGARRGSGSRSSGRRSPCRSSSPGVTTSPTRS
jgi:hypothetical protein